ncbi:hypothetical protein HanOQP8_Chr01g0023091 [Helianthus annuus]|nr:hypothetical protein HanOQP8_Chr01g0023091 [Helianthus annuus]
MATFFLSKSHKLIMHNLNSSKLLIFGVTNHTSSVANSLLSPHLLRTISRPPLLNDAGFSRCFTTVSSGRRSHTAVSFSDDVDQDQVLFGCEVRVY